MWTQFVDRFSRLNFSFWDLLDILIIAWIIYEVVALIKKNNITNLMAGLLVFVIALGLSDLMHLTMTHALLNKAIELGLIAVVILFQPELRGALERIGGGIFFNSKISVPTMDSAIKQVVIACSEMGKAKTGALIIFERNIKITEIIRSGTVIDAEVDEQLLENIFYKGAPLHDGALVIRDSRIAAAGCILPVSHRMDLSKELGLRHRAGIGVSEKTDAVVVIVSEETGAVSVSIEGMLKRHLDAATLDAILRKELLPNGVDEKKDAGYYFRKLFGGMKK